MGLYPVAGQDLYILHAPLLPEVKLHLGAEKADGGSRTLTIRAEGLSEQNRYIRSVTHDGRDYPYNAIRHADLASGGEWVLHMGPAPGDWGRLSPQDLPE